MASPPPATSPVYPPLGATMGRAIVIMGVSGCGKSTIAERLAGSFSFTYIEADDFHSKENKEKMSRGISLTDEDRIPWLEKLSEAIRRKITHGKNVSLACSALKKMYREILRSADPDYKPGGYAKCKLQFFCLEAPKEVIAKRLAERYKEGNHFMSANLLQSQLDTLEIDKDEGISRINVTADPQTVLQTISDSILDQYLIPHDKY